LRDQRQISVCQRCENFMWRNWLGQKSS